MTYCVTETEGRLVFASLIFGLVAILALCIRVCVLSWRLRRVRLLPHTLGGPFLSE